MKTIWKYPLAVTDFNSVSMPVGAKVLSVQMQHGNPTLWAIVNPAESLEIRHFLTVRTGHELPENAGDFYGTYQFGPLVFHVFELTDSSPIFVEMR